MRGINRQHTAAIALADYSHSLWIAQSLWATIDYGIYIETSGSMFSRMDQVKFVEDSLKKI